MNFYITVSRGLLDKKHIQAMQVNQKTSCIWMYLWFLDKITRIEGGLGLVLGGKPIKLDEIDLNYEIKTMRKMFQQLEKNGYLKTKRTPYGRQIWVTKAKKLFGQKIEENRLPVTGDNRPPVIEEVTEIRPPVIRIKKDKNVVGLLPKKDKNAVGLIRQYNNTDNTVQIDTVAKAPTPKEFSKMFFEGIIELMQKKPVPWLSEFLVSISEKYKIPKVNVWAEVIRFGDYWSERNSIGTKARWELQKTFEVNLRLKTWFNKAKLIGRETSPPKPTYSKGKGIISRNSIKK